MESNHRRRALQTRALPLGYLGWLGEEGSNLRYLSNSQVSYRLDYPPMAGTAGLEPATSSVTGRRADQAALRPHVIALHDTSSRSVG